VRAVRSSPSETPRLRGLLHQYAFLASLLPGSLLVAAASSARARAACLVFATTVSAMFGMSALYHRVRWRPAVRRWIRRLDHATLHLAIAGTYTPFAVLALDGAWRVALLATVWGGVAVAIVLKFMWLDAPDRLTALVAVAVGWTGVGALPRLAQSIGSVGALLVVAGGVFYTLGAVVYARQRPNPRPASFGYHELFHALVIAAVACLYASVAFFVLPSD
jgi:hemolysin III